VQGHAAEISNVMIDRVATELEKIRWNRAAIGDFLGRYLSEPKPSVFFDPPQRPLSLARFASAAIKRGVKLDRRSQLLFSRHRFYINGEPVDVPKTARHMVRQLADRRELESSVANTDNDTATLFHQWYCDGFLHLRDA
jgi:50S ribosomal protein L16 3-hydroxylase